MAQEITIGGRKVAIVWNRETEKRFQFRLSTIGGHPTQRELTTPATSSSAVCKVLWALLPASEIARFATPEDLFVEIDQESESEVIASAIIAIYAEMATSKQKKTTLPK